MKTVSSALSALPVEGQGLLIAAADAKTSTTCLVGTVPVASDGSFADAAAGVSTLLPQGLHVVGSYSSSSSSSTAWQPSNSPAGFPVITATSTGPGGAVAWVVDGQQQQVPVAAAEGASGVLQIAAGFVPVRAHVDALLQVYFAAPSSSTANGTAAAAANGTASKQAAPVPPAAAIQSAVQQLQDQLFSNPQQLVFVPDQLLEASGTTSSSTATAKQQQSAQQQRKLSLVTSSSSAPFSGLISTCGSSSSYDPSISLKLLQHTSSSSGSGSETTAPPAAPMFEFNPASSSSKGTQQQQQQQQQVLSLPLSLDVLCYAPSSSSCCDLHGSLLVPALQQQLRHVEQQLLQQAGAGQALNAVRALHFRPLGLGFPVTVWYLVASGSPESAEEALLPQRQALHSLLGLPSNIPMLRFANALAWGPAAAAAAAEGPEAAVKGVRLRNVHEALTPPGFGGKLYLVDGLYDYYHYLQDKFNDAGWGCAYRSLQTIISWFRLQHYTSKPVPGHRQIQEILVSTGDKDASLIGSSQWLGSFELGYILDAYLGITYKMVTVNQGADIPSKARELAQHFVSQGTPVMIGGGVLAYTLLGVAFNEDTGEAAFLILDPHYTGGEDLKKIVSGQWVAWKQLGDNAAAGGPLFVKDAFYNFMCPQRPRTV